MLVAGPAAADPTLYVTDRVLADLHSEPAAGGRLLRRLPTGTAVEVLEEEGSYAKVETPDGTVGWVLAGKLQEDRPAQLLLLALTEQQERTVAELKELRGELERLRERRAEERLPAIFKRLPAWVFIALTGAAAIVLFILGALWMDRRYRQRHGGFRL